MFADLFTDVGRRSVPPMIVATVMVLQRIEGCSDREAVDRFCFDARWKYAAGAWISTTRGSCTRCWWTCGPGWLPRMRRTGSSIRCWTCARRRGWSGVHGCWTRRRCMTRWPRWTPSP
ncbi:transposase [Rhodococcus opacus]|nr:transposase [Rhodococcus opacus]